MTFKCSSEFVFLFFCLFYFSLKVLFFVLLYFHLILFLCRKSAIGLGILFQFVRVFIKFPSFDFILASINTNGEFKSTIAIIGIRYEFNIHIYRYQSSTQITEGGNVAAYLYGANGHLRAPVTGNFHFILDQNISNIDLFIYNGTCIKTTPSFLGDNLPV